MKVRRQYLERVKPATVAAIGAVTGSTVRALSRRGLVPSRRSVVRALVKAQQRIDPNHPVPASPTAAPVPPASDPPELAGSAPLVRRVELSYPVRLVGRYGFGLPVHAELNALLAAGRDRYRIPLAGILALKEHLLRIPVSGSPGADLEPRWVNGFLPGLDSAAIYEALVRLNPPLYMEIGSGYSTMFARQAIRDHGLRTRIVSLDPQPRANIDSICDEVIRAPLEDADLGIFGRLGAGDVLFIDGSHICHANADVTVLFLEVLPRLRAGVNVQIHDIFLPADYGPGLLERFYSEQYLLAVQLLSGGMGYEVTFPCYFTFLDPELKALLDPLWSHPHMEGVETHGNSFWMLRSP